MNRQTQIDESVSQRGRMENNNNSLSIEHKNYPQ